MQESDIELAKGLVELDKDAKKLVELPFLVESDTLEGRQDGKFRTINIQVCSLEPFQKRRSYMCLEIHSENLARELYMCLQVSPFGIS